MKVEAAPRKEEPMEVVVEQRGSEILSTTPNADDRLAVRHEVAEKLEFIQSCETFIRTGDFSALLAYCAEKRPILTLLTPEDLRGIYQCNLALNGVPASQDGVLTLFEYRTLSPKDQDLRARLVFENNDFFLQQAVLFYGVDLRLFRNRFEEQVASSMEDHGAQVAYAKIQQATGIDIQAASRENLTRLRAEVGERNTMEEILLVRVRELFESGRAYLYHESGRGGGCGAGRFRDLLARGGVLFSNDELARRELSFPGQTYQIDREVIQNTDFVFTELFFGDAIEHDKRLRSAVIIPLITLPPSCFFITGDWIACAQLGEIDIEAAVQKFGEQARSPDSWDSVLHGSYEDAMAPLRGPGSFDRETAAKMVLHCSDLVEGLGLYAILAARKQGVSTKESNWEAPAVEQHLNKIFRGQLLTPNNLRVTLLSPGSEGLG